MATNQPALHEKITVVSAPGLVLSTMDGQIAWSGANGWYSADLRALARLEIEVVGHGQVAVGGRRDGAASVTVHSAITAIPGGTGDPTVLADRRRTVSAAGLTERLRLTNYGAGTATLTVRAHAGTDLAGIDAVRSGRPTPPVPPLSHDGGIRWESGDVTVSLRCAPAPSDIRTRPDGVELTWEVDLSPGASWSVELVADSVRGRSAGFAPTPASGGPPWTLPPLPAELRAPAEANLADLAGLLMADPDKPDDRYASAGAPWYLTLFGRDALWTARLLLPVAPSLAAGTLRVLARRQGVRHDDAAEEAPGKIPHEARSGPLRLDSLRLPALYYGTIDATPLWVCLLHDAWRAGLPEPEVAALLPNLRAAMDWLTGPDADPDGDGLIEYAGSTRGGLANQGWKDSADAIRRHDGSLATPPVALCEVQGYAYAAATAAAALAERFGLAGGPGWQDWADGLRARFNAAFWLRDAVGPYPAIALDAGNRPVSGAASNMAHLLGTGILDADQAARVAARLAAPDLTTAYGLRTLTTTSAAYNPVSYHCGSVWPHDTAIAIAGLTAEGHHAPARTLAQGLLRAARHFGDRPPELYGVLADDEPPVHYPSACRPQSWAAAAIVVAALTLAS